MSQLPLHGLVVIEFCQYLSGPSAGLRLADLGARVIKIEKPGTGDQGRKLSIKNLWVDESSLLFHTINRNKESYTAELKNKDELETIKKIVSKADVLIHNFRPGVMQKLGLGYDALSGLNPRLVYGEISGYGTEGPWKDKPGQDLLLQSIAGLAYTTGNAKNDPMPFGIAIADILCGAQLVQGLLGALIRRHKTGKGGLIQVSLLESLLDFQFELLTTYYTNGQQPLRSNIGNGHPLLSAPYGVYATKDGHIALAMMDIHKLADAIDCKELAGYAKEQAFAGRDEIKNVLTKHLLSNKSGYWLEKLHTNDLWAMEVLDWKKMTEHEAYQCLQMEQQLQLKDKEITTTRCPIRIDGQRLFSNKPAPKLGEHTEQIKHDFINSKTA
jgi:crotonobetainyl-CoA:carnitine CoA-transferase CaiB-like acyl-CoA transferase